MKNILTLLILLFSTSLLCQSNWETINISNWGIIKLPPSMEIQEGTYKKLLDEAKKEFSINSDRIIFQQKGLNDFGSFNTYARVIIRTDYANPGDLPKLNEVDLSQSELNELNSMYKQEIMSAIIRTNATLQNWTSLKISNLNGINCLYFNYTRQINSQSSTFSEFYIFYNYDKQHTLNIEYRTNDKSKWEPELDKCKSTFRFK